jgi:Protein of unknown function (DUF998)
MVRKVLLICGIVSSLLYLATDILASMRWQGYSYKSQAVSELMAIGAPTRSFMVPFFALYGALVIAFGIGIWRSAGRKWSLRITGILMIAYGAVGEAGLLLFPMHLRGAKGSLSDTMHIIITFALVLFILLFIGFGSAAVGKWFRLYSLATILTLLVFGAWAGMDGARLAANLPTPWLGIKERVNIYSSLLWMAMLAIILLRVPQPHEDSGQKKVADKPEMSTRPGTALGSGSK